MHKRLNGICRTAIFASALICVAALFLPAPGQAYDAFDPITSDSDAIAAARVFTGLAELSLDSLAEPVVREVTLETFEDSTFPHIGQTIVGYTAWKVSFDRFESVLTEVIDASEPTTSQMLCEVWLDSVSGFVLRIEIYAPSKDNPYDVPPTKEQLESEARSRNEKYLRLPTTYPEISAIQALVNGGLYVGIAPRIVIQYVFMSRVYRGVTSTFPAWVIRLHGVGPPSPSSRETPLESRATRFVVNALAGESLGKFTVEYDKRE